MPRMARVVAEGVPHHVTQRGANRQDVFLLSEDRRYYLETLRTKCRDHGVSLLGYCLITNHVHLIAVPERSAALAVALGRTHGSYARWFNRRYRRSGHLWQNRFYSSVLSRSYLATALAYVDLNPVRTGLARQAEEYEWSSARGHSGAADRLLDARAWDELGMTADWSERLQAWRDNGRDEALRQATYAGRPFGDESFVAGMEKEAGRPLRRQRPGPKPDSAMLGASA